MRNRYFFHQNWRFRLANAFPLEQALAACRDREGRSPTDRLYDDADWEQVTLPHTFNGEDLFATPIEDGGSGQKRTCAFYRNRLAVPSVHRDKRVVMTLEGVRQTCYLYVNGCLAGYYEMGVGPFGFDLTPFLDASGDNVIAVATDNTSTRNIPFCIAETPNAPDAAPGSYLQSQEESALLEGVGFSWNCNDFNPTIGGLSQPVQVYFKNSVHLTLPLYANLQSHGTYVFADAFDFSAKTARIHIEAEVRNVSGCMANCRVTARIRMLDGREIGVLSSEMESVPPVSWVPPQTLVPPDAYRWENGRYVPREEDRVQPTCFGAVAAQTIRFSAMVSGLEFWEPAHPALYRVEILLEADGQTVDTEEIETGFRKTGYDPNRGILINDHPVWLRGYAQRASNEWAESGIVPQWMHDMDARLIRESGANHIRWMHVAASPADIRSCDRCGIVCTQPAGDKERETFGRQWDQRVELMRNVILAYRNQPSILFWEAGNNVISTLHMREMRQLKQALDPQGGRWMGCRTINTEETLNESEYVGTMLNRHAARFLAEHGPITETEYSREEAPRRVWDDFSPPDFDYRCRYLGKGGKKQKGLDFYDLTSEDLALANAQGYSEFFFDRIGGASGKNLYSACAALCWTDSAQHGRQSFSENGRMSGRVDAIRVKKQSFDVFRVMQSVQPRLKILGHWNYPPEDGRNYRYCVKRFNGVFWEDSGGTAFRDPKHKTVYVVAGYAVARVVLLVNGRQIGACCRPEHGFVFAFPGVDVTQPGYVEAIGYDFDGKAVCRDRLETVGQAARITLDVHTAPGGWRADGQDLAYVDVKIVDHQGRICPLDDRKISFRLSGPAEFLGGYNSGRFQGNGRQDSVIRQPFVFAECGVNRVLLRSVRAAGRVRLTASAAGLPDAEAELHSAACDLNTLTGGEWADQPTETAGFPGREEDWFLPIPASDAAKYVPEAENYCKILVNGQEPDFRGVRAVNRNGAVWGNVLCVLERMKQLAPDCLDYQWDGTRLTIHSNGHTVIARIGETHLLADGGESLMDGQPYRTEEGILVMEVSAAVSRVDGAQVQYDEKIGALRITLKGEKQ